MAKTKQVKSDKKGMGFKSYVVMLIFIILAILYLPSAIMFFVGMLPTFVAFFLDKDPQKNKSFTIGCLNFAGCFYYLMQIWTSGNLINTTMTILTDPMTIIVIYLAAGLGYILNYGIGIIISKILTGRSHIRLARLEDQKNNLKKRWGDKVNGDIQLDEDGFPIEKSETEEAV